MAPDPLFALAGLAVGFVVGITGVGGGALMTPLLIGLFGVPVQTAVGTDLLYAALTKGGAVWMHARLGTVRWDLARALAAGSLPAAALTLWLLSGVDTATAGTTLTTVLGITLMATAVATLLHGRRPAAPARPRPLWQLAAVGAVLGVLVSLSSVGAGALGTAALLWLYPAVTGRAVVGTELAHAVPLAALAGIGHWALGSIDFALLGALLLGSLPGVYLGGRVGAHLPDRVLRTGLAGLLLLTGLRFAF